MGTPRAYCVTAFANNLCQLTNPKTYYPKHIRWRNRSERSNTPPEQRTRREKSKGQCLQRVSFPDRPLEPSCHARRFCPRVERGALFTLRCACPLETLAPTFLAGFSNAWLCGGSWGAAAPCSVVFLPSAVARGSALLTVANRCTSDVLTMLRGSPPTLLHPPPPYLRRPRRINGGGVVDV